MNTLSQAEALRQAEELVGGADSNIEVIPDRNGLAQLLLACDQAGRKVRVKFGVDPTSPDLHLGHTVGLRLLKRFQDQGHEVILIIGGYTAQLGDPTGRNAARPPLTEEQVAANARTYLDQVRLILDMEKVRLVNNADWLSGVDKIKLAARVTANQLLAKDGFGSRLAQNQPLGLHELFYPLLQGFDSVQVEADIEIGGSDQRFNILMGRQLQPQFGQKPQLAVLLPLLVGCDGERKMSKSLGNAIGLTDNPDDMFAKVMGLGDSLIVPFTELASSAGRAQVEAVKAELLAGGNPKISKENLAVRLVTEFHGAAAAQAARNEWNRVHSKRELPADMKNHELAQATEVARVLKDSGLAPSVNQARRLIEGGGVRLDGVKVEAVNQVLAVPPPAGQVLQVGRRLFVRLIPAAAV
jgi:tyrosyl-tRNA synthetase